MWVLRRVVPLLLVAMIQLLTVRAAESAIPTPNVVFIVLDDMGWGDPGAYGGTFVQTPEMDQLAAEGMRLTNYYANGPVCSPTRASILTGRYPQEFGVRRAIPALSTRGVPADVASLAKLLGDEGYVSGHFGKWHLGVDVAFSPIAHGYDTSAVYRRDDDTLSYWAAEFLIDDVQEVVVEGHLTRATTDFALDFIQDNHTQPFFVSVWYNAPHAPYEPPPHWEQQYPPTNNGLYAAMISDADEQIGEIVDLIDNLQLGPETLVIVTSDNGSGHTSINSNGPYEGQKTDVYDGGIRAPLFVRWPGTVAAGAVNDSIALGFDFMPTLAGYFGVTPSELGFEGGFEGSSLLPVFLENQPRERKEKLFWETKDDTSYFASLDGEFNRFAVREGDWKLVRQDNDVNIDPFLFHLGTDPYETNDLAAANPVTVVNMQRSYRAWRLDVTRLEYLVESVQGQVLVAPDGTAAIFNGGRATLVNDPRFDFNDADFSFETVLRVSSLTPSNQLVAERPGSWRLVLTPTGHVRLTVYSRADGGAIGGSTVLQSAIPLPVGARADISFTVFGWRDSNSTVRLYVDDVLQQETNEIASVNPNKNTIYLGNSANMTTPFLGVLHEVNLYLASLTEGELRDDDADGWRNAVDNCPGVYNPSQENTQGGINGDVCGIGVYLIPALPNSFPSVFALSIFAAALATLTRRQRG